MNRDITYDWTGYKYGWCMDFYFCDHDCNTESIAEFARRRCHSVKEQFKLLRTFRKYERINSGSNSKTRKSYKLYHTEQTA